MTKKEIEKQIEDLTRRVEALEKQHSDSLTYFVNCQYCRSTACQGHNSLWPINMKKENKIIDWEKELKLYLTSAGDRRRTIYFIRNLISQEHKQWEDDLKIGDLRQWINEKPNYQIVHDRDIKIMLGLKPKEELPLIVNRKPFNKKQFIKLARKVKKTLKEEGKL